MSMKSDHSSWPGRLLVRLVVGCCRHPWLVLFVGLGLAVGSVYASSHWLVYQTQRSDLMDPNKDNQRRWRQYLAEFGDDDDMVVVVEGRDPVRMRAALDALAGRVRQQPELFDRLFYQVDLRHLRGRALLYLPAEQIRAVQANLRQMDPLLAVGPLAWHALTLEQLLHKAATIPTDRPPDAATLQFLTQLNAILRSASATLADPDAYANPWSSLMAAPAPQQDLLAEPQYFFSGDGSLAFLLVRPVKEAGSFTPAQRSVEALRSLIDEARPDFGDLHFGLTGLPVLENDEMVASDRDSDQASWLALAGVLLLYLVVYRGLRYPLLTVVTLVVGTCWAMGWLTLTVGHLNILSATFAVMLIGMGDYGVLWVTRYDQQRRLGDDFDAATRATALKVGPSILTGASSTALAFFATMLADFKAVAELGWISGCGMLMCAFACFTVLPAMLRIAERFRPARVRTVLALPDDGVPATTWLPGLTAHPRVVVAVGLVLLLVLSGFAARVEYDPNLLHMQAEGLDSVQWELKLIERTAGASWHAISTAATPEEALALKERYEQLPEVSRVVEVASLVPAEQEAKLPLLADLQRRLGHLPERGGVVAHVPPDPVRLRQSLDAAEKRLGTHADGPGSLGAEIRDRLVRLRDQVARQPTEVASARLRTFEERMTGDLAEDLHRLKDVSTPAPIALTDLPVALRERYVGSSGKWLVRAFAKDCLWEYGPLEHFVERVRGVDPEATGKPFGTLEGLRSMKQGFLWAGAYALGAILLVLWLDFRKLGHLLLALVPLVAGAVASLGVMVLVGVPLNPANMIALPLIVGVGVDNGVHVLHDFLAHAGDGPYSMSRPMGRGIMVAALTTVLGFGTLMISSHRGLTSLGFALTLGVTCCMVAALAFLPMLLRLLGEKRQAATPAVGTLRKLVAPLRRAA